MTIRTAALLGLIVAATTSTVVAAAERHVPATYPTIQAAIDAAAPGDIVTVDDGVYQGEGNRDLSFLGKAITVRSANGPSACTIDCDGSQTDPHRGFSFTQGETAAAVLEGFTIRGGSTLPGAIADQFNGGAILCANGSSPTIRHCVLSGNWAGCWGGAICCSTQSHPTIDGCMIGGNHSDDDGGGIFAWGGSNPIIANTWIVGNTSRVTGGGITNFGGEITIRNSTIAGNDGPLGGGIYGWNVTIANSIVWGNSGGAQIEGTLDVRYSNVQGGYDGPGNLDIDPLFIDAANGNYHLADGSPMIDAGDPAFEGVPAETDADGDPRMIGLAVDLGADEFVRPGDVNRDGVIDFADLVATLAAWGPCPAGEACPADTDGDGTIGFADLLTVLGGWGG